MTTPASNDRYPAPAKINLFLHVVGRRPDGYHLIQSAMQLIDLADDLTIVARDDGRIVRDGVVPGVPEADDLAIRAAKSLQAASHATAGASIGIRKVVPMGGGLGGGSSDAATVLLVLNRLWKLDWSRRRLMELGARLGADVPFFLGGGNAFVEGIGEHIEPIELPDACYAVVHPGVAVPTATIFTAPELTRDSEIIKISDFSKSGSAFRNDLEPVASARFGAVREALTWMSRRLGGDWPGALGSARMSGSGACVFRAFDRPEHAAACVAEVPARWTGWSVRSLAAHPLRDFAVD